MDQNTPPEPSQLAARVRQVLALARERNPLTPSITNTVTTDFVANAQLAVGGSAAMIYLPDEAEAMARAGDAFYLNLGTLFPVTLESATRAAHAARQAGTPWVLDPVGIGIGSMREQILRAALHEPPAVVRCNASEAIALAQLWGATDRDGTAAVRGVDATDEVDAARASAVAIARATGAAVAVSGAVDLVTDGEVVVRQAGGSALTTAVTGSGCSLGGVAAVFAAVATPLEAALAATMLYNHASGAAARVADAPAGFKQAFIDELYRTSCDPDRLGADGAADGAKADDASAGGANAGDAGCGLVVERA